MLSKESKFLLKWGTKISYTLGGSPGFALWNKKENQLNVKKFVQKRYWFHQFYQAIYFVYLTISAITYPNRNDSTYRTLALTIIMQAILCILSLNVCIVFVFMSGEHLVNKYLNWLDYIERKFVKPEAKLRDGAEILMFLLITLCMGFPFLVFGTVSAVHPNAPIWLYNLFLNPSLRYWLRLPIMVLQLWMLLSGFSVIMYIILFALTGGTIYKLLRHEMCPNKKSYITNDEFRKPNNLQHAYRSLQILTKYVEVLCGNIIPPIQFCLNKCFLVCNYNLMTHISIKTRSGHSISKLVVLSLLTGSIISITIWVVVLYLAGHANHRSKVCLRQMKFVEYENNIERKIMSKFRKSCLPLRVWFGKLYVIKHTTFIKYFMGSIRGTGKVLIAFNRRK